MSCEHCDAYQDVIENQKMEIERLKSQNAELIGQCEWLQTRNNVLFEWKEKLKAALIEERATANHNLDDNEAVGKFFWQLDNRRTKELLNEAKKELQEEMPDIFTEPEE